MKNIWGVISASSVAMGLVLSLAGVAQADEADLPTETPSEVESTETPQPVPVEESTPPEQTESTEEPTETETQKPEELEAENGAPPAPPAEPAKFVGDSRPVLGPSNHIDSLYWSVKDSRGRTWGFVSNTSLRRYSVNRWGTLRGERVVLKRGPRGSNDHCGVHPIGPVVKVSKRYWYTFYHGDKASPRANHECEWGQRQIRGSVYRMYSTDEGRTWLKDKRVLSQDKRLLSWNKSGVPSTFTDDAGSPRLIIRPKYIYMIYRAWNYGVGDAAMHIARAPRWKNGRSGSWRKLYHGFYSQSGLGGRQSNIDLPVNMRGISWNHHLRSYIVAHADAASIRIYRTKGRDLTRWTHYAVLAGAIPKGSTWGEKCSDGFRSDGVLMPEARGYGATIGLNGSSWATGKSFWVYWMWKPLGKCWNQRYLVRQRVVIQ